MVNVGQHIVEAQDKIFYIDHQLAMNTIYSKAKFWRCAQFVFAFPLAIALATICNTHPVLLAHKGWILALYAVSVTIANLVLESVISRLKKVAASIQERFDTHVLNIEINPLLNTILIDDDVIQRYSKEARPNVTLLKNATTWYDKEIASVGSSMASLLCQRSNVNYDFSLRERYQGVLIAITVLTFIVLLGIALANELSVRSLLIEVVVPGVPLLVFCVQEIFRSKESIDNLQWLKEFIDVALSDGKITTKRLRQIQDRIFVHRMSTPLIPNFIYKRMRFNLESEMTYSVARYVSANIDSLKE